jgi:putative phage-type endonuclease
VRKRVTPYQLWLLKTGRAQPDTNAAMRHGTALEPAARAAYEERTGHIMQPLVVQDGAYSASLDGITLDGGLIVEVKCPFRGRQSQLWRDVEAGQAPGNYQVQIRLQMLVSGAAAAHLWVYDGTDGLMLPVPRDEVAMATIREGWDAFQPYLDEDRPPPLADADTVQRDDEAWAKAAQAFAAAKQAAQVSDDALESARAALVALTRHPRETGGGVAVTRFWKAGSVDYKKVIELKGVDLERYRGKAREEVRVTASV